MHKDTHIYMYISEISIGYAIYSKCWLLEEVLMRIDLICNIYYNLLQDADDYAGLHFGLSWKNIFLF